MSEKTCTYSIGPSGAYCKLSLFLEFHGDLNGTITGFYQTEYTNAAGKKVPMATSKFQPTDARSAFPCFDEPSFKSTFSTTLVRPSEGYVALSNMLDFARLPRSQLAVPVPIYRACRHVRMRVSPIRKKKSLKMNVKESEFKCVSYPV